MEHLHRENDLDATLTDALVDALRHIGEQRGLIPLDWHVSVIDGRIGLEGTPAYDRDDSNCCAWAEALGMHEYSFDTGEPERTWVLTLDRWQIEVCTDPDAMRRCASDAPPPRPALYAVPRIGATQREHASAHR